MFPDFPSTKAEVSKAITRRITAIEMEMNPVLAQMKSFTQYEGRTLAYEQVEFGMKMQDAEEQKVSFEIRLDEVPQLTGQALEQKLRSIAGKMAALRMKTFYARMDEATEQTGNRFDAGGQPPSGKMLLDFMGMGEWGFDKTGKPAMSFVIHPDTLPALKKAADEVENDPELKRRHDEIVSRQREQWLDRENRRKLVD
jgi:hypothetical protein